MIDFLRSASITRYIGFPGHWSVSVMRERNNGNRVFAVWFYLGRLAAVRVGL
jgi:hypothetical protein